MNTFQYACALMPERFRTEIYKYQNAEEIRLRLGYPPGVVIAGTEHKLNLAPVTEKDLLHVLEIASGASIHSASSLQNGYIAYKGLRIGVSGQAVYKDGILIAFRKYNSVAVRIPCQCKGIIPCEITEHLSSGKESVLICASPGIGKTTALRELVRCVSDEGLRVSLIDERGELAGEDFDVGACTDVMLNLPKAKAAMLMLRSLNPQLIAMDEITQPEDLKAIKQVSGCGVSIYATAHGRNFDEMIKRPLYRDLLSERIFENLLSISLENGKRHYRLERIEA